MFHASRVRQRTRFKLHNIDFTHRRVPDCLTWRILTRQAEDRREGRGAEDTGQRGWGAEGQKQTGDVYEPQHSKCNSNPVWTWSIWGCHPVQILMFERFKAACVHTVVTNQTETWWDGRRMCDSTCRCFWFFACLAMVAVQAHCYPELFMFVQHK